MNVPKRPGYILGWRVWRVAKVYKKDGSPEFELVSLHLPDRWPPRTTLHAEPCRQHFSGSLYARMRRPLYDIVRSADTLAKRIFRAFALGIGLLILILPFAIFMLIVCIADAVLRRPHRAPKKDCVCGIYIVQSVERAIDEYHRNRCVPFWKPTLAIGLCSGGGLTVGHAEGWRVEYATPDTLYIPHGPMEAIWGISQRYGIEVIPGWPLGYEPKEK